MKQELNHGSVIDFTDARNRNQLGKKRLEFDVERYQEYLDSSEFSQEQTADFLKALWIIIIAFVDLGHGVHPTQACDSEVIDVVADFANRRNDMSDTQGAAHA